MILYFTGTGNSKFAADLIGGVLQDEVICLNDFIKNGISPAFHSEKPFVIIAPIYAWRFPQVVEQLIVKAEFTGNSNLYFVGTMGANSGNTDRFCQKIAQGKNMTFQGFCGVVMPNNYFSGGIPSPDQAIPIIEAAVPVLRSVAQQISDGKAIHKSDSTGMAGLKSGWIHNSFSKYMASSKGFTVSFSCSSCGLCRNVCPVNNVEMIGSKPQFGNHCINCYACIHRCPMKAINIKNQTQKSHRYVCPEYQKQ